MIRVCVVGAAGKMGREIVRTLAREKDFVLVGACDVQEVGQDAGVLSGVGPLGVLIQDDLERVLGGSAPQVVCDFTHAEALRKNFPVFVKHRVAMVIGTTGLTQDEIQSMRQVVESERLGCVIAPNFAIGAVLMMYFARIAAPFFQAAEIIEYHHPQKKDAPSGTALKTIEGMDSGHFLTPEGQELVAGARGGMYRGVRVHSIRLPGFVAHQEVIFGGEGQILTLRHDSLSRSSFMPGVLLALRKVCEAPQFYYGLESILGLG
ncbi:4-hydroxy-tetrahydrodipicolinate reductase [Candidatus Caldatribacterium saccharofermentans]|uniref:4-hydroxy-tetrahydrodipicolinate reductase n=1 Tax=Candidatus Caldatribacterium saccharofermentans TaxID=1454753 RepID=A0A7V4THS5_9BACT